MSKIVPSTLQLQSNCFIDVITKYHDEKGNKISDSSIETAKDLGFDVDSKFSHTRELILTLKVGNYNPAITSIEDIHLLKDAFNALRSTTPEDTMALTKKVMALPSYTNDTLNQGWFTLTKKPAEDVEITFPNGETHLIPVKQLRLKVFSDFVPADYYTTTCAIRYIGGHDITYFSENDYIKIGCNKVPLNVVITYLEQIERDYALLLECLELPEVLKV